MNIRKNLFYLLGIIPWIYFLSILSLYFHAAFILGRLPSYKNPRPGQLPIYAVYTPFINGALIIWLLSLLLWFGLANGYIMLKRKNLDLKPIGFSFIGQSAALILFLSPISQWYINL